MVRKKAGPSQPKRENQDKLAKLRESSNYRLRRLERRQSETDLGQVAGNPAARLRLLVTELEFSGVTLAFKESYLVIAIHVAQFNADEVAEYLPLMSAKYHLQIELVELQWKLLPLTVHSLPDYQARLPRAIDDMKHRDPEDAHALALARSLDLPLWSNDKDFESVTVGCYSTARLLKTLSDEKKARG